MNSVICYLWGGARRFSPTYVNVLERMVAKYLPDPHRFICITADPPSGFSRKVEVLRMPAAARELLAVRSPESDKFPSSYPRLWTFSAEARALLGERVLLLDVDCIITGDLRPLFAAPQDFVGWRVRPPPGGPRRFGGGTWLLRTGTRTHVWEKFIADPLQAIQAARDAGYRGSDQAWISYCLSESEASWPEPSGIFCAQDYRKHLRVPVHSKPHRYRVVNGRVTKVPRPKLDIPEGAIILHMNGLAKPWDTDDEIVSTHWRPFLQENAAC